MAERYEDRYRDHGRRDERGFVDRAGDEVRSWFGDDDAERRRQMDDRERDRERFRDQLYGQGSDYRRGYGDRSYADRGFSDRGYGYGSGSRDEYVRSGFGARDLGFSGRGPKGYQRSDSRINEDVCDRLCDAADIDASNIEVVVSQGEVTLNGSVSDRDVKRRAEDLVESVSGVRDVHNNLRVHRGQDAGSSSVTGRSAYSGSGGGGDIAHPGITGGGPSGATNITTSTGSGGAAGAPENPLGLRENADTRTSTAGGRR